MPPVAENAQRKLNFYQMDSLKDSSIFDFHHRTENLKISNKTLYAINTQRYRTMREFM